MQKVYVRSYLIVVLFAAFLAALVALGIAANWGVFRRPITEQTINESALNEAVIGPGNAGLAAADMILFMRPPSSNSDERSVEVGLKEVAFYVRDDHPDRKIVEVCLITSEVVVEEDAEYLFYDDMITEPACRAPEDAYFEPIIEIGDELVIDDAYIFEFDLQTIRRNVLIDQADLVSLNFWYPFDSFDLELLLLLEYYIEYDDGTVEEASIQPFIVWDLQSSGVRLWEIYLQEPVQEEREENGIVYVYERSHFVFERPLLYRVAFPFFMAAMVLLIALMPLLGDRDTLVDITAAMLFGIFGLKGILGPGANMGQTLLDIGLIGLYVVLVFAAGLFFLNRILYGRKPPEEA